MDVRKIYEYALQREKEGEKFFSTHAKNASHGAVVSIFERLADEEKMHIKFVEALISKLDKGEQQSVENTLQEISVDNSFFEDRKVSEMVSQSIMEAMVPDLPVLRMAYLIERDLAEYYGNMAKRVDGEAKRALEMLAAWEITHENLFRSLHEEIFEKYAQMPWGG